MTKVTFMPDEEIIIHQIVEEDKKALFERILHQTLERHNPQIPQLETSIVPWVDGIAMLVAHFPDTPEVVKERLAGRLHISTVYFARTDSGAFSSEINGNKVLVQLVEMKNNALFVDLAEFLKTFKAQTNSPAVSLAS